MDGSEPNGGGGPADGVTPRGDRSSFGWWVHLGLLTLYPIVLGVLGYRFAAEQIGPALPETSAGLIVLALNEWIVFGLVLGLALAASRASAAQLFIQWRQGAWPILYGLGYSVALRILLAAISMIVIAGGVVLGSDPETAAERMRPRVEALIDSEVLVSDPVYFGLALTLISFVVAGLREELWRAGMLAGLFYLFPRCFEALPGRLGAVVLVAAVFGVGHLAQGWGGVLLTTFLGIGLGAILVLHRSIWPAVLAHGFFNATSFILLYLVEKYLDGEIPSL